MTVNANIGATFNDTNYKFAPAGIGADNPGSQTCGNCRKVVVPRATNGISQYAQPGLPNDGKAAAPLTSAGYHCPNCGHNFTWKKSTGKAHGPTLVDNTNQPSAADM